MPLIIRARLIARIMNWASQKSLEEWKKGGLVHSPLIKQGVLNSSKMPVDVKVKVFGKQNSN